MDYGLPTGLSALHDDCRRFLLAGRLVESLSMTVTYC